MPNKGFKHIKRKLSPEEFIEAANQPSEPAEKLHGKEIKVVGKFVVPTLSINGDKVNTQRAILLSVTSKINREDSGKKMLLPLRKDLEELIAMHCKGNMVGIINELVSMGLEQLIKENQLRLV